MVEPLVPEAFVIAEDLRDGVSRVGEVELI
jgi:hypothetical protein